MVRQRRKIIRVDLQGEKAAYGIELDSLERFIEAFRAALRDFERSATAREYQIGRGGHPDARSIAVTNFRLVGYRPGSAVLRLEEAMPKVDETALAIPTEGAATDNLRKLVASIESEAVLDPAVVDDLDDARRAIGDDGRFAIKLPNRRRLAVVDATAILRLREAARVEPTPRYMTVYGRLHLIATEGTPRIEIRATDGYNWLCSYPPELESKVVELITRQVQATGFGIRERANRGRLQIESIEALPQYEPTPLFSFTMTPAGELEREQGITGPQGLSALTASDLVDDEDIDRYLTAILEG